MSDPDFQAYVLSGTGNSFMAANWMADRARTIGQNASVRMIDQVERSEIVEAGDGNLACLVFPAHGLMPPWSMIKFLFQLPRRKGLRFIVVATRGCLKIGPVFVPGAAGLGTLVAMLICLAKGWKPMGCLSLDMPSNAMNLHWGLHPKNVEAIRSRGRRILDRFFSRILEGRSHFPLRNHLWEGAWSAAVLWFFPILPLVYLFIGRLFMGKIMISSTRCIGCGRCARACPNQAIVMKTTGGRQRPFWTYHCEACLRCMGYCPKRAIDPTHSFGALLAAVTSVPATMFLLKWTGGHIPLPELPDNYWIRVLINLPYFYLSMMLSYRTFFWMTRFKPVSLFFGWTSLPHWWRRYRDPETKLRQMTKPRSNTRNGEKPSEETSL